VADAAGVSYATVFRVINQKDRAALPGTLYHPLQGCNWC